MLEFKETVALPEWDNLSINEHLTNKEMDQYTNLPQDYVINKMLGYANNIQGEMETNCQLIYEKLFCNEELNENKMKEEIKNWVLLLQVDSNDTTAGMTWGDFGRLYFWIKKEDLKNKNFDKVWVILQCY